LTCGHVSSRQAVIASSSRSRARRSGFCGLQPRSRSTYQTWPGWYLTPKWVSITRATRSRVHKSVAKPATSGPCRKSATSASFCSGESAAGRPGWRLAFSASSPPSFRASFHRSTDVGVTPTSRATSRTPLPCWSKVPPIIRRASNASALPFGLIGLIIHQQESLWKCEAH